jgi:FkbM family methyltransferase
MENDLIYDVGMHNGDDTAFYLASGFRVVAVEADPDLAAAAGKRFQAELAAKRLTILNVGIAENSRQAEFWINETRSTFNSFSREESARLGDPVHCIRIPCRRLDEILAEKGIPFYLKIDIEGHDIVCCHQIAKLDKPKYISVEMSRLELLLKLQELGYDRFKLITQFDLQAIDLRGKQHVRLLRRIFRIANHRKEDRRLHLRIARAGAAKLLAIARAFDLKPFGESIVRSRRLPEWTFRIGCAGTFGDDLPGEWLRGEDVAALWLRELDEYAKMGRELWCDLHATTSAEAGSSNAQPSADRKLTQEEDFPTRNA